MSEEREKKRTTVTTIETHEVWIIRKATVEAPADDTSTVSSTSSDHVVEASPETRKEQPS